MSSPPKDSTHHHTSPSDLFSSASVLTAAARSAFSKDGTFDKAKTAEAGEELLTAASEYGKLKERGYGSYVEKAEGYLHQFHSSEPKPPHIPAAEEKSTPEEKSTEPEEKSPPEEKSTPEAKSTEPEEKSPPEEHKSGGGFGGFGGGGFGDYAKLAQGFLK